MAGGDPLSDLPRSILLYILSMLPNGKQVVRTSVLSRRWRFLWNSVPLSLNFEFPNRGSIESTLDYVTSIHRELYYLRSCEKIRKFRVLLYRYDERYAKDVDLWKNLTEEVLEKVLSGCPNLECLELDTIRGRWQSSWRLEISSVKLRKLIIQDDYVQNPDFCPSFKFLFRHGEHNLDKEFIYLKGLLHSVAHVKNLELSPWCIQCMSTLALEGWQSPPSSWKFLKRNTHVEQLDFPGIYSFLQSSSDLETLVIEWNNSTPTVSFL
ncbi:hypothetical protein FXO38_25192 [Capsicum annuum]|nr:hypothetical protein FXO38_25192 [Capsicum annuum]